MNHRIVWPIAGLLGFAVLALSFGNLLAQPRPGGGSGMVMPYGMGGQVGRFVVAHANDKQIVILDTTSGQLYKATADDYKKFSELPKMGVPGDPAGPYKDKDRGPPRDKGPGTFEKKDVDKKTDKDKDEKTDKKDKDR